MGVAGAIQGSVSNSRIGMEHEYEPVTDLESHKKRHVFLHRMLDELLADWITHTGGRPSNCPCDEFLKWANEQRTNPTGPHE